MEPVVQQQQQQEIGESEVAKSSLGENVAAEQQQLAISDTGDAPTDADVAAMASAAAAAAEVEEENRVILLNAPEPSRTKDLSATQLPPEAAQLTCLECGDPLSSDDHKWVDLTCIIPPSSLYSFLFSYFSICPFNC